MANAPVKLNDPVTGRKQLARVSRAVLHGYRSNNYTSQGLTPGIGLIDHRTGHEKFCLLLFYSIFYLLIISKIELLSRGGKNF